MTGFAKMDPRKVELYLRHIHEGGAKIAEFLRAHPGIRPEFIDEMTGIQEAELQLFLFDLAATQRIERDESNAQPRIRRNALHTTSEEK